MRVPSIADTARTWLALAAATSALAVAVSVSVSVSVSASVSAPASEPAYQLAVLPTGFTAAARRGRQFQIYELAASGAHLDEYAVTANADARVVGSPGGPLIAQISRGRFELLHARSGELVASFANASRMCDTPAASNDVRYGVAYLASDDNNVHVVHGETSRPATASDDELAAPARRPKSWCGVASAGRDLVLLWRTGDRLYFNACNDRSCRGPVTSIRLPASDKLLGAGCTERAGCLIATRDGGTGAQQLVLVTPAGGVKWRHPLDARADTISIVGAGDRAFAVGAPGSAFGIDRDGTLMPLWTGDAEPVVAASRGRVLVAHGHTFTTVSYP
jgi:hypothetical protein|nr:hypothetical protein [Kofleriaceae bacterium]